MSFPVIYATISLQRNIGVMRFSVRGSSHALFYFTEGRLNTMKKGLALIFALVTCLTLAACGRSQEPPKNVQNEQVKNAPSIQEVPTEATAAPESFYKTIEITMDNWQDYFAFKTGEPAWEEDAFGDAISCSLTDYFSLKEEYLNLVNVDTIDIAVEYVYVPVLRKYDVDWDSKQLTIGDIGYFTNERHQLDTAQQAMGHLMELATQLTMENKSSVSLQSGHCYRQTGGDWKDCDGDEVISCVETYRVSRIQGTIEIQANE